MMKFQKIINFHFISSMLKILDSVGRFPNEFREKRCLINPGFEPGLLTMFESLWHFVNIMHFWNDMPGLQTKYRNDGNQNPENDTSDYSSAPSDGKGNQLHGLRQLQHLDTF
jgi:hypothetical protein